MATLIDRLKQHGRVLHRLAQEGRADALQRVRVLPELRELDDEALRNVVRRRHCLAVFALEVGLRGWGHLTELWGSPGADDFGTLLYPRECAGHWNIWCASYEEARQIRSEHGGYLLPYKHQQLIVDRHFIEDLGLDPEDPDWDAIGRDWVDPRDRIARQRLCRTLFNKRFENVASPSKEPLRGL